MPDTPTLIQVVRHHARDAPVQIGDVALDVIRAISSCVSTVTVVGRPLFSTVTSD